VRLPTRFPRIPVGPLWHRSRPTARYLMQTEVHVYAFSMAANILLSFFPFLIVITSLCRYVLGWREAEQAIYIALRDFYPGDLGNFIERNLKFVVYSRGPLQVVSLLLLLFTANGIFEPLEVALNRAWGITRNRSYFRNQLLSLGLILLCGGLALLSTVLTAFNQALWNQLGMAHGAVVGFLNVVFFKLAAIPISMFMLFLIYWLLPNASIDPRKVIAPAVTVGLMLEVLKYVNLLAWPWLLSKMQREYGPFYYSATIVFLGFVAAMIVLAGAHWAAREHAADEAAGPVTAAAAAAKMGPPENCNQEQESIDSR
jgi:membrane protein